MEKLCFAGVDHWLTCHADVGWAAWVQAFGTIGAVVFAYWRGQKQHTSDIQRESLREARGLLRQLAPYHALLADLIGAAKTIVDIGSRRAHMDERDELNRAFDIIKRATKGFADLPKEALWDKTLVSRFVQAESRFMPLMECLKEIMVCHDPGVQGKLLDVLLERSSRHLYEIEDAEHLAASTTDALLVAIERHETRI